MQRQGSQGGSHPTRSAVGAAPEWEIFGALGLYSLLLVVTAYTGFTMQIPWGYYQVLERAELIARLGESIWYLHSQPPLLNLVLGLTLKTARALGLPETVPLLWLHGVAGAAAVYGFAKVSQLLVTRVSLRRLAIVLFVIHPVLYTTLYHYFYSFHELVIFSLLPIAVYSFARRPNTAAYAWVCVGVVLLTATHSLFHFAFGIAILVGLPLVCRSSTKAGAAVFRGARLAWMLGGIALLLAWPLKNGLIFGSYHASSWAGYNLALELPVDIQKLPLRNWSVPDKFSEIPALTKRWKSHAAVNWNHYSIIQHSKNQGDLAREAILKNPAALARKATLNYWNFTRFSGRNPYTGTFGISGARFPDYLQPWMAVYEAVVFQDPRSRDDVAHRAYRFPLRQSWALSGFSFVFPLVMVGAAFAIGRSWKTDPARSRTALFLFFCVAWVFAVALLVDGSEANRIRFSTEPYLFLLAFFALDLLARRWRGRPTSPDTGA